MSSVGISTSLLFVGSLPEHHSSSCMLSKKSGVDISLQVYGTKDLGERRDGYALEWYHVFT